MRNHIRYNNCLIKLQKRLFKNKTILTSENISIMLHPAYNKIVLKNIDTNFKHNKVIYTDTNENIEKVIERIENEYDIQLEVNEKLKMQLQEKITNKNKTDLDVTKIEISDIDNIINKLNIHTKDKDKFVRNLFDLKSSSIHSDIEKLKILYFTIKAELDNMNKIKNRIESKCNFRIRIILGLLLILLITQTGWFYNMIFHVDYLGWDIVEPTLFLLSSSLFVLGLFTYIKLNRSLLNAEHIVTGFRKKFYYKMYAKENFNIKHYNNLSNELIDIELTIENLEKL